MSTNQPKMINDMCAVLIGVDEYVNYPDKNLRGSVNDVRTWWKLLIAMGVAPGDVRVLVSPIPADAATAFAGSRVSAATHDNILDGDLGLGWLAAKLQAEKLLAGLVTYSGHGDFIGTKLDHDLALVPSDVAPDSTGAVSNEIPFKKVQSLFSRVENITTVLDCCYAGGSDAGGVLAFSKKALPAYFTFPPQSAILGSGRTLMACKPENVAYQASFMGEWHGAFTWALTSTLLQWAEVEQRTHTWRLDVTYGKACEKANALLSTLEFAQVAWLNPVIGFSDLAFFQIGTSPQATVADPDGDRGLIQFDAGTANYVQYTLTTYVGPTAQEHGYVFATSGKSSYATTDAGLPYDIGTNLELWFAAGSTTTPYLQAALATGSSGQTLQFVPQAVPGSSPQTASASWPASGPLPDFASSGAHIANVDVAEMNLQLTSTTWAQATTLPAAAWVSGNVAVDFSKLTCRTNGSGGYTWGGTVSWYFAGTSAPSSTTPPFVSSTASTTFTWEQFTAANTGYLMWMVGTFSVASAHLP
jgi:hypothetical protein